ncbi:MAG TPA: cytochrome c oxidase accessory protein CcoG [Polyangiaceae bacterium]|nr:cytochrome c oxidase accessory protein CcoG [Polyangiaceae bacterium]
MSAPVSPERVLPTLNADGSRHRIRPRLYSGRYWRARRAAAYALMALFVALPLLRMNGKPLVLLDVPGRQFVLFGRTFLPTDGMLLMLLLLVIFVGVVLVSALLGRAWCGWACPQTVYMEFLFRPIERLFEGRREDQLRLDKKGLSRRRLAKNVVFALISVALGNLFLSYFVGVDALLHWLGRSPLEHPGPFLVMAVTAVLVFCDFAYFREQMCTVACPYARLQSVLLDERSLLVGYDQRRGEPRSKGKARPGHGDCIDCAACVVACPTGIDIRQGLQLECIACTQCVDACDSIMDKIGKPRGLIRYGSQASLERGLERRVLRPRAVAYALLFAVMIGLLFTFGRRGAEVDITVLRGIGAPYQLSAGLVQNQIRFKLQNRTDAAQRYTIELVEPGALRLVAPGSPLRVAAGSQVETSLFVLAPPESFVGGARAVRFRVTDERGHSYFQDYKLLGPKSGGLR